MHTVSLLNTSSRYRTLMVHSFTDVVQQRAGNCYHASSPFLMSTKRLDPVMIPLSIDIKNFLSYGDQIQTIDFGNHALICLSGKNGNGKSALLDAITWALWGMARKVAGVVKADDGLLRLGAKRMMVALTFMFSGKTYRIRREYERSYGKPLASLDFEYFHEEQQRFYPLTDKTIRATQEKIELLLGLDFETFSNSAFLRQGQSNEFSKKMPRERKQILATILGLEKYDLLQQEATTRSKLLIDAQKIQEHDLARYQEILAQEPRILEAYDQQQALVIKEKEKQQALKNRVQALETEITLLGQKKQETVALALAKKELEHALQQKRKYYFDLAHRWRQEHRKSLHEPDYQQLRDEREQLLKEERLYAQKEQLLLKEKSDFLLLSKEYELQEQRIRQLYEQKKELLRHQQEQGLKEVTQQESFIQSLLEKKNRLEKQKYELEQESNELHKLLIGFDSFQEQLQREQKQFEKRKIFYQQLTHRGKLVHEELQSIEQKQRIMTEQEAPACPLCDSLLTQKRKRLLLQATEQQLILLKKKMHKLAQIVTKLKQLCIEQHAQLEKSKEQQLTLIRKQERLQSTQREHLALEAELAQLNKQLSDQEQLLSKNKEQQETIQKTIALTVKEQQTTTEQNPELADIKEKLAQYTVKIEQQTKELQRQPLVQEQIKKLEQLLMLEQESSHRKTIQAHLRQSIRETRLLLTKEQEQLSLNEQKEKACQALLMHMPELSSQLTLCQKELREITASLEERSKQLHLLTYEREQLEKTKKKYAADKKEHDQRAEEINEYQEIALAFSKNGIQALLIEEAVPEIEQEANTLLARLTDNQSQIFIESVRDLKSGKVKETLDIHIADSVGIRPYEMFSGGEAFRIDFALRIAISKLLARRAGTALQTLIIDEGFGSQDEEGLRLIMQALYAIQEDFAKIIIVSHLAEFKENFPVHFIVEKSSSGSHVRIEERG